jgi:hypothetical protein
MKSYIKSPEAPMEYMVDKVDGRLPKVMLKPSEVETLAGTDLMLEHLFANDTLKSMIAGFWAEKYGTADNITVNRTFNGTC